MLPSERNVSTKKPSSTRDEGIAPWYHPACPQTPTDRSGSRYRATPAPATPVHWRSLLSMAKQQASSTLSALHRHLAGLSPRSPNSLVDDLLLLFWLFISVDPEGFEPSAFSMPLRRAPNCAMGPFLSVKAWLSRALHGVRNSSGPGGIRTLDLFSAIEARSQLRYRP